MNNDENSEHYRNVHERHEKEKIPDMKEKKSELIEKEKQLNTDPNKLFRMELEDFSNAIKEMDSSELRRHILYAHGLIEQLREELEDLSYLAAEFEKHGIKINHQ